MNKILVLGAGQSSTTLINYLLDKSRQENWQVKIGEINPELAKAKFPEAEVLLFDIEKQQESEEIISGVDMVISMMPASLHIHVARICAKLGKHLLTASYVSDEIKALSDDFAKAGKSCFMELGLDPGIDHMSAMAVLDRIKKEGHELIGFETFTGGLLSEEAERDNPWKYKFTWNPRNVVLAGQGTVRFLQNGKYKYIPYTQLFDRTEVIHIPGHGYFEGYANRDSLK
jgi:saccharopine dehydrogenase (NADP+, L-glutamate forming)